MPPLLAQDTLHGASPTRLLDVVLAVLHVAGEPWALALVAVAVYSWLEGEVRGVLKAFAPLALALAGAAALALAARALAAVPRPVGDGAGLAPILRHLFPAPHAAAAAAFALYSVLTYGRRARLAVGIGTLCAAARLAATAHPVADLVGGGVSGLALAGLVYAGALRAAPGGHLAVLRRARRAAGGGGAELGASPPAA